MRIFYVATLLLVYLLPPWDAISAPNQALLNQRVTLDGISVAVYIGPSVDYPHSGNFVRAVFHAPKGSPLEVGCLSVNQDFRYQLRNGVGAIIPVNQQALNVHDLTPGQSIPVGVYPCANAHAGGTSVKWMPLATFYPNLPPGTYTLQVTFAPRGLSQEAALPPVTITVDKDHPL
jgi:hypothetical protein